MRNENTISVTCALKGVKAYDAPSGSGTLATVTFLVKAEGESPLHFNFTRLLRYYSDVDPIPIEIPHISEGGYFDNRIPFKVFNVVWKDIHYSVSTLSNSTVTHFVFNQTLAQISFNVTGEYGTIGYCNATIPKSLLSGNWTIRIDNTTVTPTIAGNDTHSFLHLTYTHTSTLRVTIRGTWVIPEFPSFLILPLFMITTLLAVIFYRRKHPMRH
jgi:hypothetical protein